MSTSSSTNENAGIAARLVEIRGSQRLSQGEFSRRLAVSLRAYQNYERGEREITAEVLSALYLCFRINPLWVLLGIGDRTTGPYKGEMDPTIAEKISAALKFESDRGGGPVEETPASVGYRLALVYNRIMRRTNSGENLENAIADEVRYLLDVERRRGTRAVVTRRNEPKRSARTKNQRR